MLGVACVGVGLVLSCARVAFFFGGSSWVLCLVLWLVRLLWRVVRRGSGGRCCWFRFARVGLLCRSRGRVLLCRAWFVLGFGCGCALWFGCGVLLPGRCRCWAFVLVLRFRCLPCGGSLLSPPGGVSVRCVGLALGSGRAACAPRGARCAVAAERVCRPGSSWVRPAFFMRLKIFKIIFVEFPRPATRHPVNLALVPFRSLKIKIASSSFQGFV